MAVQLILKNSSVADRRPSANQLSNGEIALNFNAAGAFLTCRDTNGSIQQVGGVKINETAPSTPVKQTLWLKPSTGTLSIYSGSSWVAIGAVTSVNGQAGTVTLTSADIGLGNVNNTSDLNKPVSTATQNALNTKADLVGGKVPTSQLPSLAVSEYLGAAANQAAMLLLSGERGDWCIRTDSSSTFVLVSDGGSSIGDWQELATPASPVSSVNGYTGAVVLGASDVAAATTAQGVLADSALQTGDNISELTNDENYINSAGAPVQSVNTQTGAVVLDAADVGAVNLTGDNMTGNLTLGTNNIVLNASNGSAEFAGDLTISDKIIHNGDTNTAVRFPANDTVSVETGGSERLRIDSSGDVGIGTSTPDTLLHISGNTPKLRIESSNDLEAPLGTEEIGRLEWEGNKSSNLNVAASIRARQDGTWSTITPWLSPAALEFYTQDASSSEITSPRLLIDSSGNVGIGGTLPSAPNITLNANGTIVALADATINTLTFGRGGGSVATNTAVGLSALFTNTTGNYNTAVGRNALYDNT